MPPTARRHRATLAHRGRSTHRGAELHDRLIPFPAETSGHEPVGQSLRSGRFERGGTQPGQDTPDVRVDDSIVELEGEGSNRSSRVRPDARQCEEIFERRGDKAVVKINHDPSRSMKVDGAPVVSQTRPLIDHITDGPAGTRCWGREAVQKSRPPFDHAGHLRLLQHELGHEDSPGVASLPPGKVASVGREPPEQRFCSEGDLSRQTRCSRRRDAGAAARSPASRPEPCA